MAKRFVGKLIGGGGLALLAACGSLLSGGDVEVRIENASTVTIDSVVVYPGGPDSLVATNLGVNARTPYRAIERAYRLATVEVRVGTGTARQQVIDYVGEKPLEGGRYTYRIRVTPQAGTPLLEVELLVD